MNDDDGTEPIRDESRRTVRRRAGSGGRTLWVLVEATRSLVVCGLVAVVFLAVLAAGAVTPDVAARLLDDDPVETTFQAFIGATITGVTLVLTLNQVVLSQELGAVSDQRERMSGAMAFRRDAEELLDVPVSPHDPAAFLGALIDHAGNRATTLRESVPASADPELIEAVDRLADAVEDNAEGASERLEDADFGTFAVVSAALDFNYSAKIYAVRHLQATHGDALPEEGQAALADLIETLTAFGPAREHVKTLYVQWALIDLSRGLLASAVPALVVSASMVLYYEPTTGSVGGLPVSVVAVSAAVAVATLPFAILLAYVLRIATITKRTLSIGPFTLGRAGEDDV